ncbi:MAG TPA: hypothetical protein EYF98_15035 [Planctomycetes bacterium]|jgi:hypothetical protein|nr:hypothetical protein [Planctomycetota bacterium]
MSDTNRVSLRAIKEADYGVTPATPSLKSIPFTSASDLGFTPETVVSEVIRDDRQISDLILTGGSTAGGFDSELAYEIHDELLEGVMQSTWALNAAADVSAIDIGITATEITTVAEDFTTLGLVQGQWIRVSGFADSTINGVYRVSGTVTTTAIPVTRSAGASTEIAGASVVIEVGDTLVNGVTQQSYTIERKFADQDTPLYEYLRGMVPGTFSMTATAKSLVTCAFGFTGSTQEYTTTRVTGASDQDATASGSFNVFNASSNVGQIVEAGNTIAGANFVTEATIEIENNLRERNAVGSLGAVSIGSGEFTVTGVLNTYFDDKSLAEKVVTNTESSFSISFNDNAGNTLVLDLSRVKFSEGSPEVGSKNEDVMLNLSFQAILNPNTGDTLKITRFSA